MVRSERLNRATKDILFGSVRASTSSQIAGMFSKIIEHPLYGAALTPATSSRCASKHSRMMRRTMPVPWTVFKKRSGTKACGACFA